MTIWRGLAFILALAVGVLAGTIQLAASAAYGELAIPASVPHALAGNWPLDAADRLGLTGVPALRAPLARAAVFRGDDALAERLLAALSASGSDLATVADLRGRLALRRGDEAAALRWFGQAGDFAAARPLLDALAARDPLAAYAVIRGFDRRLAATSRGAEIDADLLWREGQIAAAVAYAHPTERARYDRLALAAYERALALAPNEETYLLAYGYQALVVGLPARAKTAYDAAVRVVPDSVDAYVGRAVAEATLGDCPGARAALASASRFADASGRGPLDLTGYSAMMRARLSRCAG
jgi:predicted Zn-dependent protease